MCGIFGYIGEGLSFSSLIDGLSRLEYRGYDSCGIAGIKGNALFLKKRLGKIRELKGELKANLSEKYPLGILHTRWATHGKPSQPNAHPHLDCRGEIAIVHNGIIENYLHLKEELVKEGHRFISDTDTEVIGHLIEKFYKGSLKDAVCKGIKRLEGSFALSIISKKEPEKIIGVRKGSPLIVGLGETGNFLASDIPALLPFTSKVIYLNDEELVVLERNKASIFNFRGSPVRPQIEKVKIKPEEAEKKGYEHFMLKEIFEQPEVLDKMLSLYLKGKSIHLPQLNLEEHFLKNIKDIHITACGTAYHAGYVAKYFLEKYCDLNVEIDTSSEYRYKKINIGKKDLLIAISQSGETADTLAAVREARKSGVRILSVCNVIGSSLVKESDGLIFTYAGPEIGVASTKAYTAQLLALFLFSLYLGRLKKTLSKKETSQMMEEIRQIPFYQHEILRKASKIKKIAKRFSEFGCFLFLGRGINYPSALEGALKLKEISYIPAEGYPAGEMKHGPIALIDEYRGVVCIAPRDSLYEKMVSNIQETKARKGMVLGILNYGDNEASRLSSEIIHIPKLKNQDFSPLIIAVALQLFAYYVAKNLDCEIDQPRNLAKSVTVE